MSTRPPRLRPLLLAAGLLPVGLGAVELGVRAADSYAGGRYSRPPCPAATTAPCPLARHAMPAFGLIGAADPETGEPRSLRLNSLGLRGEEPAVPKPDGLRRVLALGDETVLAAGTPADETFVGRLAPRLGAAAARVEPGAVAEVVNAGVPGDCPLLSVLRLRRLGALQPDLILLFVRPSDLWEDARYRRDLVTDDAGRPVACPHPACSARDAGVARRDEPWWRDSLALTLVGRALAEPTTCPRAAAARFDPLAGGPRAALAAEQALAPLTELARIAEGLGVKAAVIALPDGPVEADGPGNRTQRPAVALILDAARDAGMRTFDATAALAEPPAEPGTTASPFLTPCGRLTRAGHARLAEALAEFLLSAPAPAGDRRAGDGREGGGAPAALHWRRRPRPPARTRRPP